ncbi:MAG: ATP12 family protein [Sphingomicrobium sp.]
MKRFWTDVAAVPADGGWGVTLDGRPLRTPARAELIVPTEPLANAIVAEWISVEGEIDPRAMPFTGLANAAVDRIAPDPRAFAQTIADYAEADLACYRADGPTELVAMQAADWDPLLAWARRRFDVDFMITTALKHVDQPPATVERLAHKVLDCDPFRLAALAPLVTIGGSLIAALAVLDKGISVEAAWHAVSLDDRWSEAQWGADEEAQQALEARRRDFMAAAQFLDLLDA